MTQGIQRNTRPVEFSAAYLARITPKARSARSERRDGWFVAALRDLWRALIGRGGGELPSSVLEDVGLGTHSHAHTAELRSEFNRLDAQLHARIY